MHKSVTNLISMLVIVVLVTACSTPPKRSPLPQAYGDEARIPGIPMARYWADAPPPETRTWFELSKEQLQARYPATFGSQHNYLAISGGGPNGAYAAGLLNGWSEVGNRPEFTIVTGVSAGALIAPFVFLGPEYDYVLEEVFTKYSTKDLVEKRNAVNTLLGDAVYDATPMREKIESYVDFEVMRAIAREYRRGRVLDIVTTNLDARRPVAWNIGKIAVKDTPEALALIHNIMLASAAIPVAFPPVIFEVEANGERFDELHVDGGTTSVVHLYPIGLDFKQLTERLEVQGTPNVYLIRNGKLSKSWKTVERNTLGIAGQSLSTLLSTVVEGDIYRIYLAAQRDKLDFHLAYIPEEFDVEMQEPFDQEYMTSLYELGYREALEGFKWHKAPPGYVTDN